MKLCIDLGATNVKGALIDRGKIVATAKTPTDHSCGRAGIVRSFARTAEALMCREADAVAVASAGDIDETRGVCTYATGNLEDFSGFDFRSYVKERYGLPCTALNDAFAALLGEMRYGVGRPFLPGRVAMLTLGSGVGGAYWANGALKADGSNLYARFGHIALHEGGEECTCGKRGCIEQYCSGRALNRLARSYGIENEEIFTLFRAGDKRAAEALEVYAGELSLALGRVYEVSPFDVCILGGGVAEAMDFSYFQARVGRKIVPAALGNTAGLYGAYAFAEETLC